MKQKSQNKKAICHSCKWDEKTAYYVKQAVQEKNKLLQLCDNVRVCVCKWEREREWERERKRERRIVASAAAAAIPPIAPKAKLLKWHTHTHTHTHTHKDLIRSFFLPYKSSPSISPAPLTGSLCHSLALACPSLLSPSLLPLCACACASAYTHSFTHLATRKKEERVKQYLFVSQFVCVFLFVLSDQTTAGAEKNAIEWKVIFDKNFESK